MVSSANPSCNSSLAVHRYRPVVRTLPSLCSVCSSRHHVHLGLANLRPRLSVARKVEADDNSYPSVNTCYHYLKLPDYSNEDILKLRLMTACQERGFYFN